MKTMPRIAALLAALVGSSVAAAQPRLAAAVVGAIGEPEPPPARDSTDASPSPLADVGKSAEEVATRLRRLTESLSDADAFAALEAEVDVDARRAAEHWASTTRLLDQHLRPTALDALASSWNALRSELDDANGRVGARVRHREADLKTLTTLHDAWTRALGVARTADAPASVVERAQSTLAAIDAARPALEKRHAKVLMLEDTVTRSLQTCDDAAARIDEARRNAVRRLLTPQTPPVWRSGLAGVAERPVAPGIAGDTGTNIDNVRIYARTYWIRLMLSGLIVLISAILLRRAQVDPDATLASSRGAATALRAPYAAAVLLGLLVSIPLRPYPPYAFQQLMLALATASAVLTLRPLLSHRVRLVIYAFAVLLVLNLARQLFAVGLGLEQLFLIVEMTATTALLLSASAQLGDSGVLTSRSLWVQRAGHTFARVLALGCGVAAGAAALGYLDLADFLGVGLFYGVFVAFSLLAVRVVLDSLVPRGLARGPLTRLHSVVQHRALIERGARNLLDAAVAGLWIWLALRRFELLQPVGTVLQRVLDTRLSLGELDIQLGRVLGFAAVVVGIYVVSRVVMLLLEQDVYSRMTLPRGVPYALSTLTRYGLLLIGFLLALGTLGFDLTRITVLVSALGLGIGFGLQSIIHNFVSGLILLFERPVQVGDSVQLGDMTAEVLRIGMRSSTLRTSQGAEVIVPNSKMVEEQVTNWTLSDRRRRIDLDIGVKGDADAERMIALIAAVAGGDPRVSAHPPPEALLVRFGEDSSDYQLRVWTDHPNWTRLRSDLAVALQRALREARGQDAAPMHENEPAA